MLFVEVSLSVGCKRVLPTPHACGGVAGFRQQPKSSAVLAALRTSGSEVGAAFQEKKAGVLARFLPPCSSPGEGMFSGVAAGGLCLIFYCVLLSEPEVGVASGQTGLLRSAAAAAASAAASVATAAADSDSARFSSLRTAALQRLFWVHCCLN